MLRNTCVCAHCLIEASVSLKPQAQPPDNCLLLGVAFAMGGIQEGSLHLDRFWCLGSAGALLALSSGCRGLAAGVLALLAVPAAASCAAPSF
jgi:hypothetical protein